MQKPNTTSTELACKKGLQPSLSLSYTALRNTVYFRGTPKRAVHFLRSQLSVPLTRKMNAPPNAQKLAQLTERIPRSEKILRVKTLQHIVRALLLSGGKSPIRHLHYTIDPHKLGQFCRRWRSGRGLKKDDGRGHDHGEENCVAVGWI